MSLKPLPSGRRDGEIRSSINERLNTGIQTMLRQIEEVDRERLEKELDELLRTYGEWASIFNAASKQFSDLWAILQELESRLTEWKRVDPALGTDGKWGPLSLTKRGYHFSAGIVKGDDPRAKKWMIVHFAHLDSQQDGMGDERAFGLSDKPGEFLVGIDACKGGMNNATLEKAQELISRVRKYSFIFDLHHTTLGQRRIYVHPDRFNGRRIADFCIALLMALNEDDIKKVYDLADREKVKLIDGKRKIRW